ncbi:hypothetical protein Sjap_008891 [Stephania japonica]|uniref:Uncharacterized protein n=1 Tax=Stephania japonica TaxID=461633 RepID=A0AAP0JQJ4_9MAGN
MPAIGLDVAGATLVCLILMLCDIAFAIRQRKPWIPCRFFVINSFTLTLLSVATKLPGDLTTSMPGACDQLSKLCGTAFICISIGFFRPHVTGVNESEFFPNLASLTVIVITVIVNISLQISTGAIFLFKVEHVITLVLMLLLLGVTSCAKSSFPICLYQSFRKSVRHMPRNILTLKRCYMFSYISNPQLMLYRFSPSATVGMLCTVCCVVLLQATFRTYNLDMGVKQASDYKWSVWAVVGLQILTIIVGTFAVGLRCFMLSTQMHSFLSIVMKRKSFLECYNIFMLAHKNWGLSRVLSHSRAVFQFFQVLVYAHDSLLFVMRIWADGFNELTLLAIRSTTDCFDWAMRKIGIFRFCFSKHTSGDDGKTMAMLRKELHGDLEETIDSLIPNFVLDMETCVKKHSTYPMHSLLTFLGRTAHVFGEFREKISQDSDELLLLVCLIRMADLFMPSFRVASMICALDQAFEIIVFIHEKTKILTASSYMKINVAKDIWMCRDIKDHWFQIDIFRHFENRIVSTHFRDLVCGASEVCDIIDILGEPGIFDIFSSSANERKEELCDHIEQLFVELLHYFIDQLPDAIFNGLREGIPAAQFERNVQISLKLVARLNLLRDLEPLRFASNNISSFVTTDAAKKDGESGSNASLLNDGHVVSFDLPKVHEGEVPNV